MYDYVEKTTEAKRKQANYIVIFFAFILLARGIYWLVDDPIPKCDGKETIAKLDDIINKAIRNSEFSGMAAKFSGGTEISKGKNFRECKAAVKMVDVDGTQLEIVRYYTISKNSDKDYRVTLK